MELREKVLYRQPPGPNPLIHSIFVMIRWTGLAPWGFQLPFPGSLTSNFLVRFSFRGVDLRLASLESNEFMCLSLSYWAARGVVFKIVASS